MSIARGTAALCLLALAVPALSSMSWAGEFDERLFAECAQWRGEDYALGRRALVARGRQVLPLVSGKTESADWRERALAGILKLRIESPEKVEAWRKEALEAPSNCAALRNVQSSREPVWAEVKAKPAGAPAAVLIDLLREPTHSDARNVVAVAFQFCLAPDADLARAFLEDGPWDPRAWPFVRRGLVRLGAAGLPVLREALRPRCSPPPAELENSDRAAYDERSHRFWDDCRRVMPAVGAAGELADAGSIPLLIARLREADPKYEDYIGALSGALSQLGAEQAIPLILDQVTAEAGNYPHYRALRGHLTAFGRRALPALTARLETAKGARERAVVDHLVVELSGATGEKLRLAQLREELSFGETAAGLLELHALTKEDVLPRLLNLHGDQSRPALLALGTLKDARAVPHLLNGITRGHQWLATELQKRSAEAGGAGAPPDFQEIREQGGSSRLCGMEDLAGTLSWGDLDILVLGRIGGPEAKKALLSAAEFPEHAPLARAVVLGLDGRVEELARMLNAKDRAEREAAALVLDERKDQRATRELLAAAARRRGEGHLEWRGRALASRKDVGPVLKELLKSQNLRERVLAESLSIEAADPKKVKAYDEAVRGAAGSVSGMHVLRIGAIESAGRALAAKRRPPDDGKPDPEGKAGAAEVIDVPLGGRSWLMYGEQPPRLDESHIPLLEATCLFGRGLILRGVAAFALAELGKPRSMPVLAASFDMGSLGGSNPAALALTAFGKEGAELAAKVPAPRPAEPDTGLQMTHHRAGVQVLAENKDIRGVEEILKGLAALEKDRKLEGWDYRAEIYLSAAGKFRDGRLVEPLMHILETAEEPEKYRHEQAIGLLSAYDDPHIPPMLLKRLATLPLRGRHGEFDSSSGSLHRPAAVGLTRCLGGGVADRLIEEYGRSKDDRLRAGVLMALAEISYPSSPPYPGEAKWSRERFKEDKERAAVAGRTRELAFPILVEALKDPSDHVNFIAAVGLTILAQGSHDGSVPAEKRAVKPLTDWCRRKGDCFYTLTEYLANHGDAEAGKVLLALLDADPRCPADVHIAVAVAKLQPEGAVPVLERRVRTHYQEGLARKWSSWDTGLDHLAAFGKPGADALLRIFRELDYMPYRLAAAKLLAGARHEPAVEPVEKLLRETIEAGPGNTKLVRADYETADSAHVRTCQDLLESLDQLDHRRAARLAEGVFLKGPAALRPGALKVLCREEAAGGGGPAQR